MGKRFIVALGCAFAVKLVGCGGVTNEHNPGSTADGGSRNGTGGGAPGGAANNNGGAAGIAGGLVSGGAGPGSGGAPGTGARPGTGGNAVTGGRPGAGGTSGTGGTIDAGVDGAPDDGAAPGDGGCQDYVELYVVSWGPDGGLVQYVDRSYLSTPRQYKHDRDYFMNAMPPMCMTEVMGCPSTLLADINAALTSSTVQDALSAHTVFGMDSRPVDGQVFRLLIGSNYLDVGTPCSPNSTTCKQIPPLVQALVDDLRALDAQELAKKACTDVFGKP